MFRLIKAKEIIDSTPQLTEVIKISIKNGWFSWLQYYYEKLELLPKEAQTRIFHSEFVILAGQTDYLTYDSYPSSQSVDVYPLKDDIEKQYRTYVPNGYNFRMIRYLLSKTPTWWTLTSMNCNVLAGACLSNVDVNMKVDIFFTPLFANVGHTSFIMNATRIGNLELYHRLYPYVKFRDDEWAGTDQSALLFTACENKTKNIIEMFECILKQHYNTNFSEKNMLIESLTPVIKHKNTVLINHILNTLITKGYCTQLEVNKLILEEACCTNNRDLFIEYVDKIGNKDELDHERYMCEAFYNSSYDIVYYLMDNHHRFSNVRWKRYFRIIRRRNLFNGPGNDEEYMPFKNNSDNDTNIV